MEERRQTVAVIGLGVLGLVTSKNLIEAGFDVTGFDSNNYVGGLWHYTDEDKTSVLPTTVINISKERGCFTDFPFPENMPSHCTSSDVQKYLEDYVTHFDLTAHFQLNTIVNKVNFEEKTGNWKLTIEGSEPQYFDKVVIATGINHKPHVPGLKGADVFVGQCLHSRGFKRPEVFKGKKVLVVGLGNTGADTAAALQGHAEKVFISHNHGAFVMPRTLKGQPLDHTLTARIVAFQGFIEHYMPSLGELFFNKMIAKIQNSSFNIRPEWKLSPAPSVKHATPIISDNLVDLLESGGIQSVAGLRQAVGPHEVELEDGTHLEVDTIIWCTGYRADFSILDPSVDPTRNTTSRWTSLPGSRGKPLPRLYQNVISLDHPTSLAFMGCVAFATGAFPLYDLASMAVAQIWREGNSALPSPQHMERAVDRQHAWICSIAEQGSAIPGWVRQHEWVAWADAAAGTGVGEHLGWGLGGWKFWLADRGFSRLLLGGIYSPHIFRVFDGKRKKWDGARAEIIRVNELVAQKKTKIA
ncbi:flavin monooxygenase-like protein [Xylariales sp. PMI_506]|nr:flavin monooxygenase-like protein [Xylariales sp. PMI_506]